MPECRQHNVFDDEDFEIDTSKRLGKEPGRYEVRITNLRRVRTWMLELGVVAAVLIAVSVASGRAIELLGATAVALSFAHAQVAHRLAEREELRLRQTTRRSAREVDDFVHCAHWSGRYFVAKEILWCAYFVAHGSWSALAGVGLFLAYPLWRRWWRSHHPLGRRC